MKILVVGGSQGTGAHAVKIALNKGHHVTVFSRNPDKLVLQHPQLARVAGDFHDKASVFAAVKGHDAVIVTASATQMSAFKTNPNYFSQGTQYVVEAMKELHIKRIAVLSALGSGESKQLLNPLLRMIMVGWLLKVPFQDHERQETLVKLSGLEWVVARPGRLTDGPAQHKYVKHTDMTPLPASICREDVADFLVTACEQDTWNQKFVQLGG